MCPVKERLIQKYNDATKNYSRALNTLRAKMGTSSKPQYQQMLQESEEARERSEQARLALQRHVSEHGCD